MTPLHSAVEDLKNLNRQIVKLLRAKRIRGILKTIGIGFFLYRDVDQRILQIETQKALLIKSVESAINKTSEYQKQQLNAIEAYPEFLSKDQKEKLLNLIGKFESDLEYLEPLNFLDSELISSTMEEITKSRQFIVDYNENIEKNIIKQKLMKLKDEILQAEDEFKSYFEGEQYFSKRELYSWKEKWKHLVGPIKEYIVKGLTGLDFQDSLPLIHEAHEKGEKLVEDRNKEYVEKEILKSELFEEIDGRVLTGEQRRAIVVDEASNLIVGGAGTGKTTTLLGKAFYLVSKKLATPEEVLLIAFNTDVVEKNECKINVKPGIRFPVKTYHSLGLDTIGQSRGERPTVSPLWEDTRKLELKEKILDFVRRRMSEENFAKLVIDYFLVYYSSYKSVFEFKSLGEYYQYLKESEVRSLQGDLVRSFEECDIANFLYVNGINYLYEEDYKFRTADDKHHQYKPDFFLPDYDIYIEHFGIDRNKQPAPWISQEKYIEEMEWKERTHKEHGTTLIATYSYERKEGTLLSNLQSRLMEKGVAFKPLPYKQILEKLNRTGKVNSLASLLTTFLNLYKSSGKSLETLRTEISRDDERTRTFLEIFSAIYEDYSEHLRKKNHIDFNDMINGATSIVEQGKCISPFKYILVDEFQDISQSRYRFLKALLEQNNAKLFCVGDDWQSIYRFTGGDISIMVDFEKNFGFSETRFIRETRRFSNKLCDFSTKFIMQNKFQIPKEILSKKEEDKSAVTIVKDKTEKALNKIANEIGLSSNGSGNTARTREKLWIINRYNDIGKPKNLQELIVDHPEIEIEYKTAHSSKGLETDYVAVIGLRSGILGFPCQIEDDPVLNLVLAKPEPMKNAEERRLFYVAITRAMKHVYLVVDNSLGVSAFVSEIENKGYEINTLGTLAKTINCQGCKTGTIVSDELRIGHYRCSNYPYCHHKPRKCPKCQIGFLYSKESVKLPYYKCSKVFSKCFKFV